MHHLWSPWRQAYVTGSSSAVGCIFCDASAAAPDPERDALILVRGATCYSILNLYPYNNGHLMVVPYRHIGSLAAATDGGALTRPPNREESKSMKRRAAGQ